ncbi:hypothetical protein TELCIR_02487 [Teladorsagia circumcincta]|uniref:Uncharacterized protein n=1 Tax=Teladorsagia circumcincta TaxID=45464 RepID=A0A2G9UZ31_TELCI|nr:hypothetical protein TELCIR_02487 [Teladorsagia circumcincta]
MDTVSGIKMCFGFFLMSLMVIRVIQGEIEYKVHWKVNATYCSSGDIKDKRSFIIPTSDVVFFNKTTRLILDRRRYGGDQDGYVYVKYKGPETDPKSVGVGTYILVSRQGDLRRNENPVTNGRVESAVKNAVRTGTGSDFSKMYHEYPITYGVTISYVVWKTKDSWTTEELYRYMPTSCAEGNKWMANEGFFQLNDTTGEWIPIYYDPWNTDFYYK